MKRLVISLILVVVLTIFGAVPTFAGEIEDQNDAPFDHGADEASGLDVVASDTDSADDNTEVVDVYPAGSWKSVIVN